MDQGYMARELGFSSKLGWSNSCCSLSKFHPLVFGCGVLWLFGDVWGWWFLFVNLSMAIEGQQWWSFIRFEWFTVWAFYHCQSGEAVVWGWLVERPPLNNQDFMESIRPFFLSWPQFNSLRFWLKAPKDYETKTRQQRLGFYVSIKKQQRTVAFKQKYVHPRSLTARVSEKWWLEDYLLGKWVLIVLACGIEQGHFKLNTVLLNTCNTWTWNKCLITIPSNFLVTIYLLAILWGTRTNRTCYKSVVSNMFFFTQITGEMIQFDQNVTIGWLNHQPRAVVGF